MKKLTFNGVIGGTIIALLFAVAAIGMVWTPFDPMKLSFSSRLAAPNGLHLLGTDEFGRDVLSRLIVGAQASVWIGLATVCFAVLFGTLIGLTSGYLRGWVDGIIMAFNNALLAFPGILLALGLLAVFGANQYGIIFALGIAYTPSMARIVRGAVLSLREREFIEASKVMGNSEIYTILRHILPNCLAPITVLATSMFGWAILSESALSFLGLGVPPPAPTWGNMLAAGRPFIEQAAWLGFFPGLCIAFTLLGINLLGDALRDKLDPRMRGLK
ncbi:ABC transporter permease [Phyllobacterium meliloti]|uniref:ABC transporter permease n=1 Tax=Phyllobacterium meliloti TaxID=555317 RepID=UPI000DDBFA33|nr:ABC transporter permease [Phyllobacterium sp. T1293]UGX88769.1 ABC transporter permease [Phyllobacterium sp. T1293]